MFLVGAVATGIAGFASDPGFLFIALAASGISEIMEERKSLPPPTTGEQELLAALRDSDGLTVVEAAMDTSLTVKEADGMLSELAGGGHLEVGSDGGSLVYSLPRSREIE